MTLWGCLGTHQLDCWRPVGLKLSRSFPVHNRIPRGSKSTIAPRYSEWPSHVTLESRTMDNYYKIVGETQIFRLITVIDEIGLLLHVWNFN